MKKGFVRITDFLYKNDYEAVKILFSNFRPTYIEFRYWENDVWYLYGESELFEELKEGQLIPEYSFIIDTDIDVNGFRSYKLRFEKNN